MTLLTAWTIVRDCWIHGKPEEFDNGLGIWHDVIWEGKHRRVVAHGLCHTIAWMIEKSHFEISFIMRAAIDTVPSIGSAYKWPLTQQGRQSRIDFCEQQIKANS